MDLPRFATLAEYGAHLGDAEFWGPYVRAVLTRHGLLIAPVEPGVVGTFPTFLVGQSVVKLFTPGQTKPFGTLFDGEQLHKVERSVLRLVGGCPSIPVPALIAEGRLFESNDSEGDAPSPAWPYLVMTRMGGTAWADAALTDVDATAAARQLGVVVRQVHALPPPRGALWDHDWLAEYRAGCVERQRRWGTLPAHLIDQIEDYLIAPGANRCLVHADLHAAHLFVDGSKLVGIIDWGDAIVADPYYELPALHLHGFFGDVGLLAAFLHGYGWTVDAEFVHRAMSMTLLREFDVLDRVAHLVDLRRVPTLEHLADRIWRLP